MEQILHHSPALCKIEEYDLFTGCSAIDAMILFSAPLGG